MHVLNSVSIWRIWTLLTYDCFRYSLKLLPIEQHLPETRAVISLHENKHSKLVQGEIKVRRVFYHHGWTWRALPPRPITCLESIYEACLVYVQQRLSKEGTHHR